MTRINLVDPAVLTNQHLLAEWRELPRIFTAVRKLLDKGCTVDQVNIPPKYKLGTGHVRFFYNKLLYLYGRWQKLTFELQKRDYNLDNKILSGVTESFLELCDFADDSDTNPNWESVYEFETEDQIDWDYFPLLEDSNA